MTAFAIYSLIAAVILIPVAVGYFVVHGVKKRYIAKHEKKSEKTTNFMLSSSMLGIALCLIVMSTLTFAWYTDSVSSSGNVIKAGTFSASMSVDGTAVGDTNERVIPDGTITQKVSFDISGNAKGYIKVTLYKTSLDDTDKIVYQTRTLDPTNDSDKTLMSSDFDVCVYGYSNLKMEYSWGESDITSDFSCISDAQLLTTQSTNLRNAIFAEYNILERTDVEDVTALASSLESLGSGSIVNIRLTGAESIFSGNITVLLGNYIPDLPRDVLFIDLNGHSLSNTENNGIFYVGSNSKLVIYDSSPTPGKVHSSNNTIYRKSGGELYILDGVQITVGATDNKMPIAEE